jgi:hypothetical protein
VTHYIDPRPGWITDRTFELHSSGLSYDAARRQAEGEADEKFGVEDNGEDGTPTSLDPRPSWVRQRTYELQLTGMRWIAARDQAEAEADAKFGAEEEDGRDD